MKVIYMGTPSFALKPLEEICKKHDVVLVVTREDKPNLRGKKIEFNDVKRFALENHIPVFQPVKVNSEESFEYMKSLHADVMVVCAYGQILKENILNLTPFGAINIHGSILPYYRGAAPMQRAIMAGEKEMGITIMYMDKGMDTGDVIQIGKLTVEPSDDFGTLHDKLSVLGAELIRDVLDHLQKDKTLQHTPQDSERATYANKITKEDMRIDFSRCAIEILNKIKALSPAPGAGFLYKENQIKVIKASVLQGSAKAGEVISDNPKDGLVVGTGKDLLKIEILKVPGKKAMESSAYLRGNPIEKHTILM